jgi:hypothetical protein
VTTHRFMNIVLFLFVVVTWIYLLGFSYAKDEEAEAIASREWVARQKCGPEASWRWDGDNLQCLTKHGKRTGKPVMVAGVKP